MENIQAKIHQLFNIPYTLHSSSVGSGPPVVLLHGIATSSESWKYLTPMLSPYFKCTTIDLLGFGESPKPDWYAYTPNEHINNIRYTIKRLGIKKPFVLVGHSMGSLLAVSYANSYPKHIKRLILLSPPLYFSAAEMDNAKILWREIIYSKSYQYFRTHKKFTLSSTQNLKKIMLKKTPFYINEQTWNSFSKSLEECIEKQNVVNELEHLSCPIDVFYGSLDQLIITKNIQYLSRFPNVNIHPLRLGHIINLRYSRSVAQNLIGKS